MRITLKQLPLAITAATLWAHPFTATAQQSTSVTGLEEIIVTARRRQESLQEVPISISAIDSTALERLKLESPEDLQFQVPSLMVQGGSKDQSQMSLRGQYVNDTLGTTDAPVNVYFGEALVTRPMGTNQSMYDLEQVQVLKGVQGTLFGRNSTGGALIIRPAAPSDIFEGYVKGSYGNYNHREFQGMINLPMGDTLALRVAGKMFDRDGFGENLNTGQEIEDKDMEAWRVSLRWNPTETIESTTIYDHYRHDQSNTNNTLYAVNFNAQAMAGVSGLAAAAQQLAPFFPAVAENTFPASLNALLAEQRARSNPRDFRSEVGTGALDQDFFGKLYSKAENWGLQNITAIEFDTLTIKNIAAYREMELDTLSDLDGGALPLIASNMGGQYDFFSNELQFLGTAMDDRLDWIAGLYYMKEDGSDFGNSNAFNVFGVEGTRFGTFGAIFDGTNLQTAINTANAAASGASRMGITSGNVENSAKAAYLGLTYRINETWTLAGGLRYNEDKRSYTATSRTVNLATGVATCDFMVDGTPLPIGQCNPEVSKTFRELTYDATLSYNVSSDSMVYGSFRHGYRTGGFNGRGRNFAELVPYSPEKVDEFELGFKSDFKLGTMPVRANGAIFYQDYQDIQQQINVNIGTDENPQIATVIQNAADGSIHGGELELEFRPTDYASLSLFYSYLDGEFDDYIDPATGADLSDRWLVFAARHMGGATLNLFTDLDEMGELIWTLNAYAQSKQHMDEQDTEIDQSGYTLVNASLTWERVAGSKLDLRLWGRNLTGKEYRVGGIGLMDAPGFATALWGAPRTYGLDLTYRFGE